MLKFRPKVNRKDEFGNSLLHYACVIGNTDLQQQLISIDFDVIDTNDAGMTPLQACILSDSFESFKFMLEQEGIKRDYHRLLLRKDMKGRTCLHLAVKYSSRDIFYFVLDVLENYDTPDDDMKTALMYAIDQNNGEFVQQLLNRGSNIYASDSEGNNILFYAVKNKNISLFESMLREFGEEAISKKNDYKEDLLYAASTANSARLVRLFLGMGLNPKAKTKKGICALDIMQKSQILMNVYREFSSDDAY